jgi:hypothetical protein
MAPPASDRNETLLVEAISKLTEQQKETYDLRLMLAEDQGLNLTEEYRLSIAATLARGMPDRDTAIELKDQFRREEWRQQHVKNRSPIDHEGRGNTGTSRERMTAELKAIETGLSNNAREPASQSREAEAAPRHQNSPATDGQGLLDAMRAEQAAPAQTSEVTPQQAPGSDTDTRDAEAATLDRQRRQNGRYDALKTATPDDGSPREGSLADELRRRAEAAPSQQNRTATDGQGLLDAMRAEQAAAEIEQPGKQREQSSGLMADFVTAATKEETTVEIERARVQQHQHTRPTGRSR